MWVMLSPILHHACHVSFKHCLSFPHKRYQRIPCKHGTRTSKELQVLHPQCQRNQNLWHNRILPSILQHTWTWTTWLGSIFPPVIKGATARKQGRQPSRWISTCIDSKAIRLSNSAGHPMWNTKRTLTNLQGGKQENSSQRLGSNCKITHQAGSPSWNHYEWEIWWQSLWMWNKRMFPQGMSLQNQVQWWWCGRLHWKSHRSPKGKGTS